MSYDLFLFKPISSEYTEQLLDDEFPFDRSLLNERGYVYTNTPFNEGADIVRKIKRYGGNATLVPVKYREPKLSLEAARPFALKRWHELVAAGRRLEPLDAGESYFLWWSFRAV